MSNEIKNNYNDNVSEEGKRFSSVLNVILFAVLYFLSIYLLIV